MNSNNSWIQGISKTLMLNFSKEWNNSNKCTNQNAIPREIKYDNEKLNHNNFIINKKANFDLKKVNDSILNQYSVEYNEIKKRNEDFNNYSRDKSNNTLMVYIIFVCIVLIILLAVLLLMIRKRKINRKKKVKSYFQKIDGAITNNSVVSSNLDTIKNTVTVTIYNDNIPSKQDNGDNINTITLNDNISSKQGNGDNINTIALNDNISSKQGNGDNINIIALNDNISSKQNNGDNVNTVISSLNDNIPLKQDNGDNINTIISSIETSLNPSIPHNISQGNINDNSYHIASTSSDPIENSINRDNINDDIDQSTPPLKVSINKQIPKGYKSVEKSSESLISEIPLINQTTFSPPKPESISEYKNKFSKIKSSIENFNSELQLWTNKRYKTEKSNENSIEMNIQKSDEKENNKVSKFNENLQLWTNITENITESTRNKEIKSKILYKKYEIIKSNSIESSNNIDPTFSNNLQLWINNNNPETFNFTINEETKLKKIKNENEKRKYTSSDSYSMDEIDITFKDNLNLWVNGGT